jgi:hypothetical protein
MLIATKTWRCDCERTGCSGKINPGDQFNITEGTFYKINHSPEERKIQKIVLTRKQEASGETYIP